MRLLWHRYKYLLILFLIFIVAEIIINPLRNFPLNDDWSYSKSVLILHEKGELNIGNWGAMTLVSHLLWGGLFTKVFGFSFIVLRISTLVSSFIGLFFLYKTVIKVSQSALTSVCVCAVILFNPLYFNLSNTYMTDVNFNTALILFIYTSFLFFENPSPVYLPLIFLYSLLLIFLRQFGIIAPLSFCIACLFLQTNRLKYFIYACLLFIGVYLSLKYYENSLREYLASSSSYKFSGNVKMTDPAFWDSFRVNLIDRYKIIFMHCLIYAFPLAIFFFRVGWKNCTLGGRLLKGTSALLFAAFITHSENFPYQNVFRNMILGPETFYESLTKYQIHNQSSTFELVMTMVKYFFSFGTIYVLLLNLKNFSLKRLRPKTILILILMGSYILMLLITESFFDRYHIPLITLFCILIGILVSEVKPHCTWELIPLVLFAYISVAGTKDYLEMNTQKWAAYEYVKVREQVDTDKINAGFEINCWNEGRMNWWSGFMDLQSFDYLIQYNNEPGFALLKEFPFTRYFPYKKDKVCLFYRIKKSD